MIYHKLLAFTAASFYRHPSREMLVIGVTGTNGKSSTCHLIARVLDATGHKVGLATTVEFQIGEHQWLNKTKMTMLGRFQLQKLLRKMADNGVKYVVLEVSSQGLIQHRADMIDFDIAVFTNLTREHIDSHGSFENYKEAKGLLFDQLSREPRKYSVEKGGDEVVHTMADGEYRPITERIAKTIIVNGDDKHAAYFLSFNAEEKYCFGVGQVEEKEGHDECVRIRATDLKLNEDHSEFCIGGVRFRLSLPGEYNVYNALGAITVGLSRGMGFKEIAEVFRGRIQVLGRFEEIEEGQDFKVIVDYAPEPESMRKLYGVVNQMSRRRIIHVLGSCGGGRDKGRRSVLGHLAARYADVVVVTNEDPYDDDPMEIIEDVFLGANKNGKKEGETLFKVLDRSQAIQKAVDIAKKGDIVLITGKGAEQAMCVAGGIKIPWDDRVAVRDALKARQSVQKHTLQKETVTLS